MSHSKLVFREDGATAYIDGKELRFDVKLPKANLRSPVSARKFLRKAYKLFNDIANETKCITFDEIIGEKYMIRLFCQRVPQVI